MIQLYWKLNLVVIRVRFHDWIQRLYRDSSNCSNIYAHNSTKLLNQWDRVTHICISKMILINSDNGLSPGRRQAIIWTNAGILLIGPLGINFSEISTKLKAFSFTKMHLSISPAKWKPSCLGHNGLSHLPWWSRYATLNWVIFSSDDEN